MANIKSAKKRIKTNEKARLVNKSFKSSMKTSIKKVEDAIVNNKKEEALVLFKETTKLIDKAVNKGILHKNNAGRKKSRLMLKINSI